MPSCGSSAVTAFDYSRSKRLCSREQWRRASETASLWEAYRSPVSPGASRSRAVRGVVSSRSSRCSRGPDAAASACTEGSQGRWTEHPAKHGILKFLARAAGWHLLWSRGLAGHGIEPPHARATACAAGTPRRRSRGGPLRVSSTVSALFLPQWLGGLRVPVTRSATGQGGRGGRRSFPHRQQEGQPGAGNKV